MMIVYYERRSDLTILHAITTVRLSYIYSLTLGSRVDREVMLMDLIEYLYRY
jgi:hypothetical protein